MTQQTKKAFVFKIMLFVPKNFSKNLLLIFLLSCLFFQVESNAQKAVDRVSYQEIGGWIGVSNYYGDLNPNFGVKGTRPAFGGYFRHTFTPYIAVKLGGSLGFIGYKDSYSNSAWQQTRNLAFRTHIAEIGGQLEFNFLRYVPTNKNYYATPYLTLGLSMFHFSPKAKYEGEWYKLKDIGTEGQLQTDLTGVKPYKTVQPAIPVGIGFKYWLKGKWTLSTEISYRFTFTDYLDDVHGDYISQVLATDEVSSMLSDPSQLVQPDAPLSNPAGGQRGDSVTKDSYLLFQISLSYAIFKVKCPN